MFPSQSHGSPARKQMSNICIFNRELGWVIFTQGAAHSFWGSYKMETHVHNTSTSSNSSQVWEPQIMQNTANKPSVRFHPSLSGSGSGWRWHSGNTHEVPGSGNLRWCKTNTLRLNQTKGESFSPNPKILTPISSLEPRVHGAYCGGDVTNIRKNVTTFLTDSLFLLLLPLRQK